MPVPQTKSVKIFKMRILIVNNFFSSYGGAEIVLQQESSLLKENGHQVFFFSINKQPLFEKDYEYTDYFPEYIDYKALSKIQSARYFFKAFYNFEAESKLKKFIMKIKPDIVHCHNIHYHLTPSVLKACYNNNIPVVMTLHDSRLMCPGGTLMIKPGRMCKYEFCVTGNPLYCLAYKCKDDKLISSFMVTVENLFNKTGKFYKDISFFICPSKAIYNLAKKSGIKETKLKLIHHYINDSFFNMIPEYSNNGYFLFVGRLSKEKGLNYLLEAMNKLPDVKLHIVGNGPEEENLRKQAMQLGLNNVEFKGYKSGKDLEIEYKNCIASILPCYWFETFGLTIAETFTYGKPVIASRIGAIPEFVENGKTGITFEPGNINEMAASIKKLHLDNDLVIKMGKQCRNTAEKLFSAKTHYNNLISIYNLAKRGSI